MSGAGYPPSPAKQRRFRLPLQFSLRTLLAAITLFGVVFGWRLHRARLQRDAVTSIRAIGGRVSYDYHFDGPGDVSLDPAAQPWEPAWLLAFVGIDFFHDVAMVNMITGQPSSYAGSRNIAPTLAHLPRLRSLTVGDDNLDNAGMATVGRLKQLEFLYLNSTITDDGFAHLRDMPRLTTLNTPNAGDRGLATVAKLPRLELLIALSDRITDSGLAALAGHAQLKALMIGSEKSPISDAGLIHVAQIPNLESLSLGHIRVSIDGLKPLQDLVTLKELGLYLVPAIDYASVAPLFPKCKVSVYPPTPTLPPATPPATPNPFSG